MLRLSLVVLGILLVVSIVTGYTAPSSDDVCGGFLSGDNGTITSPNYPHNYTDTTTCVWTITVEPEKVIRLTFSAFNVEWEYDCSLDWVLIENFYLERKECGISIPDRIWSNGNYMIVTFHSGPSGTASGFRATWAADSQVCGGALSGDYGIITSPGYPHKSWNFAYCVWSISVEPGKVIQLTFHQFAVEWDPTCSWNWVIIYDNSTSRDNPLWKKCGFSIPEPYILKGNQMFVEFLTGSDYETKSSFRASWAACDYSTCWTDPDSQVCGGDLSGTRGIITSPDYPNSYRNRDKCVWSITVEPGKVIRLTFSAFNVEWVDDCSLDWVLIYDNSTSRANPLGKKCGSFIPEPIWSNGNRMFVEFETDSTVAALGFRAEWAALCGGVLSGEGTITSPYYPNAYGNDARCLWTISVEPGKMIKLTFDEFGVDRDPLLDDTCEFDWVLIYDNTTSRVNPLWKKCGSTIPAPIYSNGNQMFVEFFSDYTRTNIGFVARWTALPYWQECGGHLSGNFGIVTLPVADFPNHNRNRAICAWIITVEPGKVIRLTFSAFNVTREYRCCFDWLIIFDSSQTEMQRHCEPSIPEPFLSQGNKVYLWFYFNWCLTVAGFRAEWEAAASFSQDLQ